MRGGGHFLVQEHAHNRAPRRSRTHVRIVVHGQHQVFPTVSAEEHNHGAAVGKHRRKDTDGRLHVHFVDIQQCATPDEVVPEVLEALRHGFRIQRAGIKIRLLAVAAVAND
jgi:hypothetical protein